MKKVCFIIRIKTLYMIGLAVIVLTSMFIISYRIKNNQMSEVMNPTPSEEVYQQITSTLLMPYVTEEIDNYYKDYLKYTVVAPWSIKILKAEKTKDFTYEFLVEIEVAPYVGAHNSVGVDHLTFRITPSGEVILEKYEHIKSYAIDILPHMRSIIIKWPPKEGSYEVD